MKMDFIDKKIKIAEKRITELIKEILSRQKNWLNIYIMNT